MPLDNRRKYCNELESLVFSVDYPLAPGCKFPDLIEHCIRGYLYVICLLDKVLQLGTYDLVLTGDSAGGNLCMAILNWILMNELPKPKGLLLCYPVCNVNMNLFSPSYLHTLHDYLLNFNMLNLCFKCYFDKDTQPEEDFMIRCGIS